MAPAPGPTPAPIMAPRATSSYSYTTIAPLTTIWTPPASCATQRPTILAGTCYASYCSSYPESSILSDGAALLHFVYWTTSRTQVTNDCVEPSSQAWVEFSYSPARGCPSGWETASASRSYNGDVRAVCCPSTYDLFLNTYYSNYLCKRRVFTGETMNMIAYGKITVTDDYGYSVSWYASASSIGTTVLTTLPTFTAVSAYENAMVMVVPSSWVSGSTSVTPTTHSQYSPSTSLPPPSPSGADRSGFHIGNLTTMISIVVSVAIGIVAFLLLCCCCKRMAGRRRSSRPPPRPVPDYPLRNPYQPRFSTPLGQQQSSIPVTRCTHRTGCFRDVLGNCCFCARSDTTGYSMLDSSLNSFCSSCQNHWQQHPEAFPAPCTHKIVLACSKSGSNVCCGCADTNREIITLNARLRTYCVSCNQHWRTVPTHSLPGAWTPIPACEHLLPTKCIRSSDYGCCCACTDRRPHKMSLRDRVANFCPLCYQYWMATPPSFPPHWLPFPYECPHLSTTSCTNRVAGRCCPCKDFRDTKITKKARLATYCTACKGRLESLPNSSLPYQWQPFPLECSHAGPTACTKADDGKCCACKPSRTDRGGLSFTKCMQTVCNLCAAYWRRQSPPYPWSWKMQYIYNLKAVMVQAQTASEETHVNMFDAGPKHTDPALLPRKYVLDWFIPPEPTTLPKEEAASGLTSELEGESCEEPPAAPITIQNVEISGGVDYEADQVTSKEVDQGPTYEKPKLEVPVTNPIAAPSSEIKEEKRDSALPGITSGSELNSANTQEHRDENSQDHRSKRGLRYGEPNLMSVEELNRLESQQ